MIKEFFDKHIGGDVKNIAVAVSGGADSMALCFMLSEYFSGEIHALTVDHGLRESAAGEALHVAGQLSHLSNVNHHILKWEHGEDKPKARIQERARFARYDLMSTYMKERGIIHLFLGHHMDDQAETFLFRLAKGSGVDGLSCMLPVQKSENGIFLCRLMLGTGKSDLIKYCNENAVDFIDDPSNVSDDYARARLRKSMDILAGEGLSAKRLSVCASRHARARKALEMVAKTAFYACILDKDAKRIVFNKNMLLSSPEEIILRIIMLAMTSLNQSNGYGARTEKIENLCSDFVSLGAFRRRTLGGIIFECNVKKNEFIMSLEKTT